MDIEQIKTFLLLAQTRSYTKTAATLHITQPAVSNRIKALEDELGQKLLEIKKKEVLLTPAGQYFYDRMSGVVSSFNETINTVKEFSPSTEFSVGASPFCSKYVMARLLPRMYDMPNYVPVNIRTVAQPHQLIEMYEKGIVDLAMFSIYELPRKLKTELLWYEPIILVSQPDHPLRGRDAVTLQDMKDYPLSMLATDRDTHHYNYLIVKLSEMENIRLNIKTMTDNIEVTKEMVKTTERMLSFLPELSVREEIERGELIRLPCRLPVELSQKIYLLSQQGKPFHADFCELLREFAADRQREIETQQWS